MPNVLGEPELLFGFDGTESVLEPSLTEQICSIMLHALPFFSLHFKKEIFNVGKIKGFFGLKLLFWMLSAGDDFRL